MGLIAADIFAHDGRRACLEPKGSPVDPLAPKEPSSVRRIQQRRNRLDCRPHTEGFTLIEMMIVIAISAIVLATLVPNFAPAIERAKLNAASRDVVSALRHCRGYAMIKGEDALFEINTINHTYRISGRNKLYHIPESIQLGLFTTTTETLDEGTGRIRFFPDGSATGGRVTLIGQNQTLVIDINWLTGEIKLGDKDAVDQ